MEARIAEVRLPDRIATRVPDPMSVAMIERQLELLDGALAVFASHELVEEELQLLARQRSLAEVDSVLRDAQLEPGVVAVLQLLAPQVHGLAPRRVVEHADPVGLADQRFDVLRGNPRRVRAAYERAHARARDAIDRNPQLLEHLEHTQVGAAARAAAAQHEADARALLRMGRRRGHDYEYGRDQTKHVLHGNLRP